MNNIQTYKVQIKFKEKCTNMPNAIVFDAGYKQSNGKQDTFRFSASAIELTLVRSKKYDTIITRPQNSINSQIIKALIAYYAVSDVISPIKDFTICRVVGTNEEAYSECEAFQQPLRIERSVANRIHFPISILSSIVENTPRGAALRIALSYWLNAMVVDNVYLIFENLWRAFNRLYVYQGNVQNETDNMAAMRRLMIANQDKFPKSIVITNGYSKEELHAFRWQQMILNDYATSGRTSALVEFVERYSDSRIMALLKEKLVCREMYISGLGKWAEVQTHLSRHAHTTSDIELVTILCIKYAYFIRNKYFHGETLDGTFKLKQDNIDLEFERISKLLSTVLFEIIDGNILRS